MNTDKIPTRVNDFSKSNIKQQLKKAVKTNQISSIPMDEADARYFDDLLKLADSLKTQQRSKSSDRNGVETQVGWFPSVSLSMD